MVFFWIQYDNIQHRFELNIGNIMPSPNPLSPSRIPADQRIEEIAHLLANAFIRLKSDIEHCVVSDPESQFLLEKTAQESVHGTVTQTTH